MLAALALIVAAAVAAPALVSAGCGNALHAHCQMKWSWTNSTPVKCEDVYNVIVENYKNCPTSKGCTDKSIPSGQTKGYVFGSASPYTSVTGTMHWGTRYIDDQEFTFNQGAKGCEVEVCSHSESLSYYDYDANYCNTFNLIRGTPFVYAGFQQDVVSCRFRPAFGAPAIEQCNKY